MITFEEYENALKQRHGERIHNILSHSSVAIAGLGGLGSNIAMYLARAGVGHLHLVDFDKVDITNLNRQQYDIADLGTLKTDALTKNIKRFNPFIEITSQCVKVNEDNAAEIFGGYKIVCEAFDKAENKAMLVNSILSECGDTKIVSGSGMARMSFREYVDRAALIHLLQSHRQPACIHLLTVHWDIWKIAEQPVNLLLIIPVPRNKGMYPIFTKQSCHIEPIHMTCVIGINNTVAFFQRIFRCLFVFPRYLGRVQDTDYAIRDRKGKLRCKSL